MILPELLAPAGSFSAMVAAVQCGADAVYLGASDFNARRNAENFGGALDEAVRYCHVRAVKVYVTLNTMVRQEELRRLASTVREISDAGADGVIVQDFGVARAVRQMAPTLPLHASTQMAVHNPQGVEFLVRQGFSRVVLAREMTLSEIAQCSGLGAELEVFIHGALCVACSGQCLLSSMIGGRSGNRGLCAQPCRTAYTMGDAQGHLLSTKDLCGLDALEALANAGASSLKIEGRLKRPEYVAVTTSAYREALDALRGGKPFDIEARIEALRQMFNRGGFTQGYFPGVEDAELMYPARPNHIGVEIGACVQSGSVELTADVDAQDALVLRRRGAEDIPVRMKDGAVGHTLLPAAKKGDRLVRLVSQAQMEGARSMFAAERRRFPIDAELTMRVGEPAQLRMRDGTHAVGVCGETVQAARSKPADPDRIRAQIEKLGDTPFDLRTCRTDIDENAFLPVSALNALRREACEQLIRLRGGAAHPCADMALPAIDSRTEPLPARIAQSGDVSVLMRAANAGCERIAFAPEDLRRAALDAASRQLPAHFDLALPPVAAGRTLETLHAWARDNASRIDRVYITNVGQLALDWPGERIADAQLNAANDFAVAQLKDWGMETYVPSVELNASQIRALGGRRELTVYGRLPLMHLRHCPLRAAKKLPGKHAACRRCDGCAPSERIDAQSLTDRTGASFPLRRVASDEGCVIRLLNSAVLMPLRKAKALPESCGWRLLLDADDPVEELIALCDDARRGKAITLPEGIQTTSGHYFRGVE